MTIPPIIFQEPGWGEALQKGVAPLINALEVSRKLKMQQQELDIQQQRAQTDELRQRQTARNEAGQRLEGLMRELGPGILDDPSIQQFAEQAGINPKTVLKTFTDKQKAQQAAEENAFKTWVQTLPDFLRAGQTAAFDAIRKGGAGKEQAADLASAINAASIKPEQIAIIDTELPELKDLPLQEKLKAYTNIHTLLAESRLGIGAEGKRQADIRLAEGRLTVQQARQRFEAAKEPTSKLTAVNSLLRIVDQQLNDMVLIGSRGLIGKTTREKITALFGAQMASAYEKATQWLQTQVPEPGTP